ncbi:hypothetical protein ASNO1_46810 [Corallococcus caeni]|uniref:Uncharacterized protein n=1 Tax=Corallococcus caeni TaxID=3082388 RepID=A0ABQ6QYT2_9BACT|nr:hypothetical protein ASNO1_46810 [Corallococcus sp. NO1]
MLSAQAVAVMVANRGSAANAEPERRRAATREERMRLEVIMGGRGANLFEGTSITDTTGLRRQVSHAFR